jgi:hypothetical protein
MWNLVSLGMAQYIEKTIDLLGVAGICFSERENRLKGFSGIIPPRKI